MLDAKLRQLSGHRVIQIDGGPSPSTPIIILHGYGADAADLASLAEPWCRLLGDAASSYRFLFPDAPSTLEELGMPWGRAWWPINMSRLMSLVEAERFDELHDETPPGINEASQGIEGLIQAARNELQGDSDAPPSYVLGGFSQGAMLSMHTSACGEIDAPAALFLFSGTVVCRSQWKTKMKPRLSQTKIVQSHGTMDPVLPFESAITLRDDLLSAELSVSFCEFPGQHTIGEEAIHQSAALLESLVS